LPSTLRLFPPAVSIRVMLDTPALTVAFSDPDLPGWAWLLLAVTSLHWIGPIAIRFTMPLRMDFHPLRPGDPAVPAHIRKRLAEMEPRFRSLGFEPIGTVAASTDPRMFGVIAGWRHTHDVAQLMMIGSTQPPHAILSEVVHFVTFRRDGSHVETENSRIPMTVPPDPRNDVATLPDVRDPARLWRVHRHRVEAAIGRGGAKEPPATMEELQRIGHADSIDYRVRGGYGRADEAAGVLRMTWKGAFVAVFRLLPPLSTLSWLRNGSRASALLAATRQPARAGAPARR
jgi:hypothetical protein